ncbi:MAG: hypothetical protein LUI01_06745 [Firmicutes bacterium]|nr:hypothetical protein [Bacillota bacterium]
MKAQKRRIPLMMAVIVFAAAILGVLLGAGLYAATSDDAEAAALSVESADTEITITVENPLYAGVAPSSDARLMSSGAVRLSAGGTLYSEHHTETYNSSADTVAAEIRAAMVARSETVTVTFETTTQPTESDLSDFVNYFLMRHLRKRERATRAIICTGITRGTIAKPATAAAAANIHAS